MKEWKTIVIGILVLSLVAMLVLTFGQNLRKAPETNVNAQIKERIEWLKLMEEEQRLTLSILKMRAETEEVKTASPSVLGTTPAAPVKTTD